MVIILSTSCRRGSECERSLLTKCDLLNSCAHLRKENNSPLERVHLSDCRRSKGLPPHSYIPKHTRSKAFQRSLVSNRTVLFALSRKLVLRKIKRRDFLCLPYPTVAVRHSGDRSLTTVPTDKSTTAVSTFCALSLCSATQQHALWAPSGWRSVTVDLS